MTRITLAIGVLALTSAAGADVAFDNFGAGNSYTGNGWLVRGPLITSPWTHAFRFTPTVSGTVTSVTVAVQHLGGATNSYVFEMRADGVGMPGPSLGVLGQVVGFSGSGAAQTFAAAPGVSITAGTTYWLYGRGEGDANGTWRTSPNAAGGTRAYSFDGGSSWTVSAINPPSAIGAFRIEVQPGAGGCYANCDGSTTAPVLNVLDFGCFLNQFAAGDSYANCDQSTTPPVLNVLDFGCFLNAFAAGCT